MSPGAKIQLFEPVVARRGSRSFAAFPQDQLVAWCLECLHEAHALLTEQIGKE